MTLRAILLDLGGPVLNEDAEYASWEAFLVAALLAEGREVTADGLRGAVQAEIAACNPNAHLAAVWRTLRPDLEAFRRVCDAFRRHGRTFLDDPQGVVVRPEARAVIPALAARYTLGIAANQPVSVLGRLEEAGLLQYFRWKDVSEGMRVAKPAPLFFQMILDGLGVRAEEAVMVGDRLDFDVYPAKLLGMKTVRVLVGPYAGQQPPTPWHVPDRTVAGLGDVPDVVAEIEGRTQR